MRRTFAVRKSVGMSTGLAILSTLLLCCPPGFVCKGAAHLRKHPTMCSSLTSPSPRPLRAHLFLRGGGDMADDDDDEEVETKDKYEFNPPPDEERYTHGVPPRGMEVESESDKDEREQDDDVKTSHDSSDDEPQWVEGQVKQGGIKLKYVDGHADYHRDVLNSTHPQEAFVPDYAQGQTYSDFSLIHKRHMAVTLSEQDGETARIRAELNASLPTHNWTWTPIPNYTQREYHDASEYKYSTNIYQYDIEDKEYKHTKTFKYHESLLLNNRTRQLGLYEARAPFVPPAAEPVPSEENGAWRILKAVDDEERWKKGELPMPLNDEDYAEIERDQADKINEQLCEAAEHGATGMFNDLVSLGGNVSYSLPPDDMTPLHYAALNGHIDIVKILLEAGVDVNATDEWDRTPLHWAAYNGHTEVAQILFDAGAHVMAKTKGGSTPYAMAALFMHTHDDVISFFREEERKYNKELEGFVPPVDSKARQERDEKRRTHPLSSVYS